jgi:hypothetical protein
MAMKVFPSPLSGVFCRAPGPNGPPFQSAGDAVAAGDTVGLIEVMKTFTPVLAEEGGAPRQVPGRERGRHHGGPAALRARRMKRAGPKILVSVSASQPISTILSVYRSEIAVRVILAARDTPAMKLADEAVEIVPPQAKKFYFSAEAILPAAVAVGADALGGGTPFSHALARDQFARQDRLTLRRRSVDADPILVRR